LVSSGLYEWREDDAEFAEAWERALRRGLDSLEDVAVERAKAGSDLLLISF